MQLGMTTRKDVNQKDAIRKEEGRALVKASSDREMFQEMVDTHLYDMAGRCPNHGSS